MRPSYVYFIQGAHTGRIKIGHAVGPMSRMKAFQTASCEPLKMLGTIPFNSIEDSRSRERYYHEKFRHLKVHGEWFAPGAELIHEAVLENMLPPEKSLIIMSGVKNAMREIKPFQEGFTECTTASSSYAGA